MKLASIRSLEELKPVLKNPQSLGQNPVYWVFSEITDPSKGSEWANVTIISPGKIGGEYPKTFGHYHPENAPDEIYHLIEGEGILQLQKKHLEDGVWNPEKVDEVYLIKAKVGDEIVIKKEFGHSWSNMGSGPLISFDNWRSSHTPSDYEYIEKLHGMAYYLIEADGQVKAVPNPNYKHLPEPVWLAADEFRVVS